jgi:thiamine kinase-like enzyme
MLATGWGLRVADLEYLPVGFGAHHWRISAQDGRDYFLALHDLGEHHDAVFDQLKRALDTAHWLQHARQLEFVLAPVRNQYENVAQRFSDDSALAVYPWLNCRPRPVLDGPDVADLLARLHASTRDMPTGLTSQEDFRIPWRTELEAALMDLDRFWDTGPYAELARVRLRQTAKGIRDLLDFYDRTATETLGSMRTWVITHGEPYGPNLVETDAGRTLLVDWDSALLAPLERDLWELPGSSVAFSTYSAITGTQPAPDRLRLYRAWYHLAETAIYTHQFRQPHRGNQNDATAWENFLEYLPTRLGGS